LIGQEEVSRYIFANIVAFNLLNNMATKEEPIALCPVLVRLDRLIRKQIKPNARGAKRKEGEGRD
jgi:hypothetical protein